MAMETVGRKAGKKQHMCRTKPALDLKDVIAENICRILQLFDHPAVRDLVHLGKSHPFFCQSPVKSGQNGAARSLMEVNAHYAVITLRSAQLVCRIPTFSRHVLLFRSVSYKRAGWDTATFFRDKSIIPNFILPFFSLSY